MKIGREYLPPYIFRDFLGSSAFVCAEEGWRHVLVATGLWVYHEDGSILSFDSESVPFAILRALSERPASISSVLQAFGDCVSAVLVELWVAKLIYISDRSDAINGSGNAIRFCWLEEYLKRYSGAGLTPNGMIGRLREATVCIVGLGGLGSMLALSLSASGVGCLKLVDGDVVEESNLSRQIIYRESDIGKCKVHALADVITANNSCTEIKMINRFVESASDAAEALQGCNFVVLCADQPRFKIKGWIGQASLDQKVPLMTMAGQWVGPVSDPFKSPCYACIARLHGAQFSDAPGLINSQCQSATPPRGSFGPRPLILAGQISAVVIHYLTGIDKETPLHRRFRISMFGDFEEEKMIRYKDCRACGSQVTS